MEICSQCQKQSKKYRGGRPHEDLTKIDEPRIFIGNNLRGFKEQDYQCLECKSKFTWSTNKNDLTWTLWQG
jgi:hypothetical protein